MSASAQQYFKKETLRNGLEIVVRSVRPDDAGRIVEAFDELEAESVYMRFFAPKKEITENELQDLTTIDFNTHVMLLGIIERDGREIVIASGTYIRTSGDSAEVAFVVEEDYQRLGIARRLLTDLGKIAVASGFKTFTAEVLPYNAAMLGVFKTCGWPMKSRTADGTIQVTLDLENP